MRIRQLLCGLVLVSAGVGAHAITVLSEGFDNITTLAASGWAQVNNSTAPVGTSWFQGNTGVFSSATGAANSYIAANFLSTGSATGAVSNWLITPVLTLDSSSVLSFLVRTAGDDFLDTLEVRLSTNGSSTNVGTGPTGLGDFTTLLGSFQASTATGWVGLSYTLNSLTTPATGRLAFRYVVANVSTAGNYIGIDSVAVTAVPEPMSALLMAMGVSGLLLVRRRA